METTKAVFTTTDIILMCSASFAGIGAIVAFIFNTIQVRHSRIVNLNAIIPVERSLGQTPSAFRFHGISEQDISAVGVTADELAYLVANFTAGGVYHRAWNPKETKPFPPGSYRYEMLATEATRRAWPLIRRMLNKSEYTTRIEATIHLQNKNRVVKQ